MAAVAARYARALADVVLQPGREAQADAVERELHAFRDLLQESADLRNALTSPAVKAARKRAVIEKLGERAGLSRTGRNLLFVLSDHRRLPLLGEVLHAFRVLVDERLGYVEAEVTSARPIEDSDRAALEAALARHTGRKVRAHYAVDAGLIGGAVTRIGSTIYDGSVREQLRVLRERLSS
jgi:F-type H+-transporting ATPase subunit delta